MGNTKHFDDWAPTYDEDLQKQGKRFPFIGYDIVIASIVDLIPRRPIRVLDLGVGTGNLAVQIVAHNPRVEVWAIDSSRRMLERAQQKLPGAHLIQADLRTELLGLDLPRFGSIVSAYVFHELPDEHKVDLIEHLLQHRLEPSGCLIIGDIAFTTTAQRDEAHRTMAPYWDAAEHYLVAEDFLKSLHARGINGAYRQISVCAGIVTIPAEQTSGGAGTTGIIRAGAIRTPSLSA